MATKLRRTSTAASRFIRRRTPLIALLILTAVTVGAAYINLGSGNIVIALAIATVKAILVALFFMHLRWEKPMDSLIAMAGFIFLGIFIGFCLLDFDSRNNFLPVNSLAA